MDTAAEVTQASMPSLASPLVLMVEDDNEVAAAVIGLIEDIGFTAHWVTDGMQALEWMRAGGMPALVFSDILMPGEINGIELAAVLANEFPHLSILLTSGYASKAQLAGWAGLPILHKPYRADELRRAIAGALGITLN